MSESSVLHDWSNSGLLYGIEQDSDRECCSFMFEEAYDYLQENRRDLSDRVLDNFLPVVRLIFELNAKDYENINHEDLSEILSDVIVELDSKEFLFEKFNLRIACARKYITQNG